MRHGLPPRLGGGLMSPQLNASVPDALHAQQNGDQGNQKTYSRKQRD
jgi:hypothetical protein